jgi:hypothetical protein
MSPLRDLILRYEVQMNDANARSDRAAVPVKPSGSRNLEYDFQQKSSGSVDIQAELLGVFWLTYLNAAYVTFFGDDKFNGVPGVRRGGDGCITIVSGDSPKSVTSELRERVAATLGKQSLVNPTDILGKQRGRFALTFQQLLAQR